MMYDTLSQLYDAQYRYYRDDLAFYRRLAEDYGSPILEIGAGTGRVTKVLAQTGAEVVALDSSATMLDAAKSRLAQDNLAGNVHYVQADMCALETMELIFSQFSLIVAPFNVLMHLFTLEEQDTFLRGVKQKLAPQGRFAFDLYTYQPQVWNVLRQEPYWQHVELDGVQGELFVLQRHDASQQRIDSDYYWDYYDRDYLQRQKFSISQRYYHRYELERWLRSHNLNYNLFGDFDRSSYQESSPHLIVTAQL